MKKEDIQLLIDRYEEGLTSNAEEKTLRQYILSQHTDDMPQEWAVYKAIFTFIGNEQHPQQPPIKKSRSIIYWLTGAIAAACVAAAIIIITIPTTDKTNYAVINGRTTTDREMIAAEAEAALYTVTYTDNDTFEALDDI